MAQPPPSYLTYGFLTPSPGTEEYNKRALSVIYDYINQDAKIVRIISAGYDRDLLERGYKGEFIIHDHDADDAGKHWDIRLEFPVTSLRKSLGKYTVKRPSTNEPIEEEYPDKPGTILRSFVDKKREIPTSKNKIFLVETEDHPILYGKFEGEIEEGYGKGEVKIWDKGTYELLDASGDNKYTFDFKGKKLNGIYAFIKYQKGYLWIKAKQKKVSAINLTEMDLSQIDSAMDPILNIINDLQKVSRTQKKIVLMHRLNKLCKDLDEQYSWTEDLQKNATDNLNISSNWKEKMIIFKYITRHGYNKCSSMLSTLLKDGPYHEIINQFIPD